MVRYSISWKQPTQIPLVFVSFSGMKDVNIYLNSLKSNPTLSCMKCKGGSEAYPGAGNEAPFFGLRGLLRNPDRALRIISLLPPPFNICGIAQLHQPSSHPRTWSQQSVVQMGPPGADCGFRALLLSANADRLMRLLWEGAGFPRSEFPIGGWVGQLFCLPPSLFLSPSTMRWGSKEALSRCWANPGTTASVAQHLKFWAEPMHCL